MPTEVKIAGMESTAGDVLVRALESIRADASISCHDALASASELLGVTDDVRRDAMTLFADALVRPETGKGTAFQEPILERAIRQSRRDKRLAPAVSRPATFGQGKMKMSDQSNNDTNQDPAGTIVSNAKRYTVGDTYQIVATMGLKPTDAGAVCGFQFSRKTGKDGVMDLPAGTEVRYVGAKAVYESKANSKRMIFRAAKGSKAFLDGKEIELDSDIEIAGVVNHIDADDPYNVKARETEAKRAERAELKARAVAAKTEAA